MDHNAWRDLRLSLERPYKTDNGEPIPNLLDITPQGEFIYESQDPPSKALGENLKRIFIERGVDFLDKIKDNPNSYHDELPKPQDGPLESQPAEDEDEDEPSSKFMSAEELMKMRMELAQELVIAQGEMEVGKALLETILSSVPQGQPPQPLIPGISSLPAPLPDAKPPPKLSATIVTKPSPIQSVQAFNTQLVVSSKDETLRAAADVFKAAADSMERSRVRGEKYWVDALKIRRANWGLVPAPLPFGAPTGKGADKTSKDFLIAFGLEESAPIFKRRAMGHMPPISTEGHPESVVFPQLNHLRLCVSLSFLDITTGQQISAQNALVESDTSTLENSLRAAHQEVVEQEIFSFLVKEASNLPTATARVSERLIVLDAAHGLSLKFELVNVDLIPSIRRNYASMDPYVVGKCDLIFYAMHALLIRAHGHLKRQRLGNAGVFLPGTSQGSQATPSLLQPILDMLQYEAFCLRLRAEVDGAVAALTHAGVSTTFRFDPVGDVGMNLLKFLQDEQPRKMGGEMVLRIEDQHTLRMTMTSPAAMTVHLAQASIAIHTIPQFGRLLADELERCLLLRICELGNQLCESANGTWFVDFSRCIGKWEGCALNFQVAYRNAAFSCSAIRIDRSHKMGVKEIYSHQGDTLLGWVETLIHKTLNTSS